MFFWSSGDVVQTSDGTHQCQSTEYQCYRGVINRVIDGNTLEMNMIRTHLSLVHTPEYGESGYAEATRFTKTLCPIGSSAVVYLDAGLYESMPISRGKIWALVFCGETNLNAELLNSDHAEIDTDYCSISEFAEDSWAKSAGC